MNQSFTSGRARIHNESAAAFRNNNARYRRVAKEYYIFGDKTWRSKGFKSNSLLTLF